MAEKTEKKSDKKKVSKKGKGKYHEKIKVDATFQELINMAASGKEEKHVVKK